MLIQQTDNIRIKAVEAPDLVDQLLIMLHGVILYKILDFVKYFIHRENTPDFMSSILYIYFFDTI